MDFRTLFDANKDRLEDFWHRRQSKTRFERRVALFDRSLRLSSNHEGVLAAIDACLPLYSTALQIDEEPFAIQLVVQAGPLDPGPVPDELMDLIQYTGDADWLSMQLGAWGRCHVDLSAARAVAVLAPQLADRPDLIARCLLNTVITNFFIAAGYAMLHASCLVRGSRALLLMAPHNTGKSTTALRLVLAGHRLLSDSMVFVPAHSDRIDLYGFSVGRIKLRQDMVPAFPELQPMLETERVRGEKKYSVDLRRIDPALVYEKSFSPSSIDVCLLAQNSRPETVLETVTREVILEATMLNSLFYDTRGVWQRNWATLERLIDNARWHRLSIGSDPEAILATVAMLG
jgi:hypothetical protein